MGSTQSHNNINLDYDHPQPAEYDYHDEDYKDRMIEPGSRRGTDSSISSSSSRTLSPGPPVPAYSSLTIPPISIPRRRKKVSVTSRFNVQLPALSLIPAFILGIILASIVNSATTPPPVEPIFIKDSYSHGPTNDVSSSSDWGSKTTPNLRLCLSIVMF
jgi:hypothetical protein